MKLMLIGAGALGSRHLQSCLKFKEPLDIYVVDTSGKSLALANQRAGEIAWGSSHEVQYLTELSSVYASNFDFLVLATGASVRYRILREALERFSIQYALLEKVLFQDLSSYDRASDLIAKNEVTAFVNCPRRAYPFYRRIKAEYFEGPSVSQLRYYGGEWIGLACNTIHFLDLINFLTGEDLIGVSTDHLDDGYIKSKRIGHIELTGRLEARFSNGSKLSVESMKGRKSDSVLEISTQGVMIVVDELAGRFQILRDQMLIENGQFDLIYQSDLTHKMIGQICETRSCDLPSFSDSVDLHKIYIRSLLIHYNKYTTEKHGSVPIT